MLRFLREIISAKSLHGSPYLPKNIPSLSASNSLTVHGDYLHALSLFFRHVKYAGRPLKSDPCNCLSTCLPERAAISDMSKFTSDVHASLVIRVIHCIAARHPSSMAGQSKRDQILDIISAG